MRSAETMLGLIHERGKKGLPLERVYRLLYQRDLYLLAYGKLYRNHGALTPGSSPETVDAMSLRKIDTLIAALRQERYRWTPVRRVYIEKKRSTKKRPLGMPTWSDKLLQEVLRLLLVSYFEPTFSDHSHGFRPGRGCHTALNQIDTTWYGISWFIEGDIKACFERLSHERLLSMLAEHIHDGRFLRLVRGLLQAGYLEEWKYHATLSGAPQGGTVSPVLSNIYLSQLDRFIEDTLIPTFTRGAKRKRNPHYLTLLSRAHRFRKGGKKHEAGKLRQAAQRLPSIQPDDPDFRRLHYVRYADDWLLGFAGPRAEAEQIKAQIRAFLHEELQLELSEEKTLITHAQTEAARFLSYQLTTSQDDTYQTQHKRRINGQIRLGIPPDILHAKCRPYQHHGKPTHRPELTNNTAYSIVAQYQSEYRGLVEYYQLANDLHRLNRLKWVMQQSLTKTLAAKYKVSVKQVYRKYQASWTVKGKPYTGLQVTVPRGEKPPLIAKWGGIPLTRNPQALLNDHPTPFWAARTELEKRLLADTCELCGSQDRVEVHHIRALKDLHAKGRKDKPLWVQVMIARRRKTLVLCWSCHRAVHAGHLVKPSQP
jgi:group II intron reverse transcriptase/maturase